MIVYNPQTWLDTLMVYSNSGDGKFWPLRYELKVSSKLEMGHVPKLICEDCGKAHW